MKSKLHQNEETQVCDQNAKFTERRQNTLEYINIPNVRSFVPCVLNEILKSQIWPVSLSQNGATKRYTSIKARYYIVLDTMYGVKNITQLLQQKH